MIDQRIKCERQRLKLSQAIVAEKLDIAQSTYASYESGSREPSRTILVKLSDLFDCSTDYLLGKTNVRRHLSLQGEDLPQALRDAGVDVYELTAEAAKNGALSQDQLVDLMRVLAEELSKARTQG